MDRAKSLRELVSLSFSNRRTSARINRGIPGGNLLLPGFTYYFVEEDEVSWGSLRVTEGFVFPQVA